MMNPFYLNNCFPFSLRIINYPVMYLLIHLILALYPAATFRVSGGEAPMHTRLVEFSKTDRLIIACP